MSKEMLGASVVWQLKQDTGGKTPTWAESFKSALLLLFQSVRRTKARS